MPFKKGYKQSKEHKRKLKLALTGRKLSENQKKMIGDSLKGRVVSAKTRRKIGNANRGKKGYKQSKEHKKAISEANKGHVVLEVTRRKQSLSKIGKKNPNYGKKLPEKTRRRMSEARKGIKLPEKTRRRMSEARKGEKNPMYGKPRSAKFKMEHSQRMSGEKHPLYGTHLSEKTRRKLSLANLGKKLPEKTRRRMSEGQKGHVVLEKTRRKISSKNKGRIMSEEFRQQKRKDRAKQRLPRKDSKPEKFLQKLCKEAEIEFQTQKDFNLGFQNHQVDLFIEPNICIEVDGDYPHANPQPHLLPSKSSKIQLGHKPDEIMYSSSKIIKTAKWTWEHDAKITQVLEQQGNVVLRFWQSELETEPEKCLQKILKAIK